MLTVGIPLSMEAKTVYFRDRGKGNTEETFRLAKERADQLGIRDIIVASYTGYTALKALEYFQGYNLVIVAGVFGFREPNQDRLPPEVKEEIKTLGKPLAPQSVASLDELFARFEGEARFDEEAFILAEKAADGALYRDPRFRAGIVATLGQTVADFRRP